MAPPTPPIVAESSPLYPVKVAYFYRRCQDIGAEKGGDHAVSYYETHFDGPAQEIRARKMMVPWL